MRFLDPPADIRTIPLEVSLAIMHAVGETECN